MDEIKSNFSICAPGQKLFFHVGAGLLRNRGRGEFQFSIFKPDLDLISLIEALHKEVDNPATLHIETNVPVTLIQVFFHVLSFKIEENGYLICYLAQVSKFERIDFKMKLMDFENDRYSLIA